MPARSPVPRNAGADTGQKVWRDRRNHNSLYVSRWKSLISAYDCGVAIVFLPLNGIGLGHLSRSFALAESLRRLGEAPVIFAQGEYLPFMARTIPGTGFTAVYKAPAAVRQDLAATIAAYAQLTDPAVVVDDTHPAPLRLPDSVQRFLVIRPTSIDDMRLLRVELDQTFRGALIADHPESPTWPYTKDETGEIASWPRWFVAGPIFRRSTRPAIERVRRKYAMNRGAEVVVFSMGGGGVQENADADYDEFCHRAAALARRIRSRNPRARLIFVRGPLFPASRRLPSLFEDAGVEPDMPALLAAASAAVVRPGYNTTWECIAGGTPILPVRGGATFAEPVADRLRKCEESGLIANGVDDWTDAAWLRRFESAARRFRSRWPAGGAAERLRALIAANLAPSVHTPVTWPERTRRPRPRSLAPLLVRIDDVTEASDDLLTMLRICAARGLPVSLEVIPYLCRIDERSLRRLGGRELRFEVSQHGWAHLPPASAGERMNGLAVSQECRRDLRAGMRVMQRNFPRTFRGGFSAPYDSAPIALFETWYALGGRYASVSRQRFMTTSRRIVRLAVNLCEQPLGDLVAEAMASFDRYGYAGVVLHPRRLERERLETVLDAILRLPCTPRFVSEAAEMNPGEVT